MQRSHANELSSDLGQTQRVELIAFPDPIGERLRKSIGATPGRDCLRFRLERLAPDVLQGESLVRCIWIGRGEDLDRPHFPGVALALGEGLSSSKQAEIVRSGFCSSIDLQRTSVDDAAELIAAYCERAAEQSKEVPLPLADAAPILLSLPNALEGTELLAAAVEMLEVGVYLIDESQGGVVSIWNQKMERLFQRRKQDAFGRKIDDIIEDPLVRNVLREMPSPYSRNRAIFPSKGFSRKNLIADISKSKLFDSRGSFIATAGFIQDVTNRIHSENRLIAAFNELESSKEKLEHSNLEIRKGIEKAKKLAVVAQSSNKAKSYFLSNISHELRTPLNSIVSLTHALLEGTFGELNSKQHENLEIVSDSSKHLHSLINDILDLSKIELGKMNLKFAPANPRDIAQSSIRMIEQEASQKNVSCVIEMLAEQDEIEVDARRLRQILLNLLVNAVKFTKPKTDITLRISEDRDSESLVFEIEDHGIGISKEDFSKIFSPFTQLDDSLSRQYEGTGLGLAIASKFVELHGGGLKVKSEQGKGSVFSIYLPARQPKTELANPFSNTLAEIAADSRKSRNLCLVVDECERSAILIRNRVKQIDSLNSIITLPNEISAYHDQIAPRVILADLNVINTHGADWIAHAKKLPAWKRTKWVAVCSIEVDDNRRLAKKLGFEACLSKPLSTSELSKLLNYA